MASSSIVISNYTDKKIVIAAVLKVPEADGNRRKLINIDPRNSHVLFTDNFVAFTWEKPSQ